MTTEGCAVRSLSIFSHSVRHQIPSQLADEYTDYDAPHLIMTYTSLMSLAILRDDFTRLDRAGILRFVRSCQQDDGRYVSLFSVPSYSSTDTL